MIVTNVSTPTNEEGWFKSSRSNAMGSCVEIKFAVGAILVRDSKDRRIGQPIVGISSPGWSSFLSSITGEA